MEAGLVERDATRRPHRFSARSESPIYNPLRQLLEATVGVETELRRRLEADESVRAAAIHGSWVTGSSTPASDVDVVVVGRPDLTRLRRDARSIGRQAGRQIDITAFSPEEFERRRKAGEGFVRKLLNGPRVALVGDLEDVE